MVSTPFQMIRFLVSITVLQQLRLLETASSVYQTRTQSWTPEKKQILDIERLEKPDPKLRTSDKQIRDKEFENKTPRIKAN